MPTNNAIRHKATVTNDEKHRLLSVWHRRAVLDELDAHGPLSRHALADRLAAREDAPHDEARDFRISLRHAHLPRLVGADALTVQGEQYTLGPTAPVLLAELAHSVALGGDREAFR